MRSKKAESASMAAAFVAIMTVLIVLYILFLPPDIRTELLGDGGTTTSGGSGSSAGSSNLLKQTVGQLTYLNTNEKTYDLPAIRIYSPTSAQIIKSVPQITTRNGLLDKEQQIYTIDFIVDKKTTNNVLLSFNVLKHKGAAIISLNGRVIYNSELSDGSIKPFVLDASSLSDINKLTIQSPSSGWAFWSTNTYTIENLQITGDVTDYSNSEAISFFSMSDAEQKNLESIRLYFYPNCDYKDAGSLKIELNRRIIYNSVADCGTRTFVELSKDSILKGSNELRFGTDKGSYLIDNPYLSVKFQKPVYKALFFDVSNDYFTVKTDNAICGASDGLCPVGCSETTDGDCCFKRNGFWCGLPTANANDRCVFYTDRADCLICKTGYITSSGYSPDNCKALPGDNNDNNCSGNVNQQKYYDKDCCFADNSDNYFCKEVPITGISDRCKTSISPAECDLCYSGYTRKDGSSPASCGLTTKITDTPDEKLLNNYDVNLKIRFTEKNVQKRADFSINGHIISVSTLNIEENYNINNYVRSGANSIEIIPLEDINIAEISVDIKQVN